MASDKLTGVRGVSTPKLNMLNKDPVSKSILSLLTPEENKAKTKGDKNSNQQIPKSTLDRISQITSTSIDANRELMEAVPGAFKALSILQAAILSPRNLTTINLSYESAPYEGRNNDLNNMLLNKVKDYVENNYKITDRLQDLVADILFYKGSRAIALLSSSALDNIINGHVKASMEALEDEYKDGEFVTRGYLGDNDATLAAGTKRASLESLITGNIPAMTNNNVGEEDFGVTVTDNDSILRLPQLKMTLARNAMSSKVRIPQGLRRQRVATYGIEALDDKGRPKQKGDNDGLKGSVAKKLDDDQYVNIYNQLFKQRDYKQTDLVEVRRDDELTMENVDAAMWIDLPSESFVPVHLPGNPRARIGGYVLLDPDGNPLSTSLSENGYQDNLQNKTDTANAVDGSKGIVEMAREYREGNTDNFSLTVFRRKVDQEIERDLVQRIANGTFGQKVALGMNDEVKNMMAARALRNLKTKVLFIPEESLVYFAFDFNRFGIGRSLLERSRLYASMAMANVISTTLANISASTNVTTLGITLDPDNPEPDSTVEAIVTTHLNSNRSMSSLIGARNPRDVINIMDEAGVIVKTSGHPGYPDIDVDVSYDKRQVTPPDSEWNDRLLEILWGMWGVPPELLSSQNATTFAVEHINNNALFRKATGMQRNLLCATLSELVQKLIMKSGNVMNDLYDTIMDNKKLWSPTSKKGKAQLKELKEEHPEIENNDKSLANFILVNFINSIELTLPEPLEGDVEDQNRSYDTYRERYEKSIKDIFPDEVLTFIMDGQEAEKFEAWRQNLVSHKMREWMAGSGSYEDLTALCEVGDDTNATITLLASMVAYNEQSMEGIIEYLKLNNKLKDKLKKSFEKLEVNGDLTNNPAEPGFDGYTNGGDGTEPGAEGGVDEFGNPIGGGDPNAGNDAGSDDFSADGEGADNGLDGSTSGDFSEGGEGDQGAEASLDAAGGDPATMSADAADATDNGELGDAPPVEETEPELDADGNPVTPEATNDDAVVEGEVVPELDENGNELPPAEEPVEPELDADGNPIVPDATADEAVELTPEEQAIADAEAAEAGAGADDVKPDDFVEEVRDDHSDVDFTDEVVDEHSDEKFEEEKHDDGSLKFEEGNADPDDLEFEEPKDGKPAGRSRKSKRSQKKEAQKAKEKDDGKKGDANDDLNFDV